VIRLCQIVALATVVSVLNNGAALGAGGEDPSLQSAALSDAPSSIAAAHGTLSQRQGIRTHGLPPGLPMPSWAKHRAVYFLPPARSKWGVRPEATEKPAVGPSLPKAPNGNPGLSGGQNELGSRCTGSYCPPPPLRYLGGKVQHEPKVHLIFWGKNWTESPGSSTRTEIVAMLEGLSKSKYQEILTQYFDPTGRISPSVIVDSFTDTRVAAPKEVNDSAAHPVVAGEVEYAIEHNSGWKREPNAQFMVLPAPGTTYEKEFTGFCAYHGVDEKGGIYSIEPYAGDEPFSTEDACKSYYGGGDATKATSVMASHEYAEAATDPLWNTEPGWMDSEGYELSDMCATPFDTLPNGTYVQGQYDDHQNACSLADEKSPQVLALTDAATNVTNHSATLHATINPESLETTYHFEYGLTKSYGTTVPAKDVSVGSGRANVQVEEVLSSLTLEQTFHYRVVATNSSGTTYGEDRTVIPSSWAVRTPAKEPTWGQDWLNSVSCWSESSCIAVGANYDTSFSPEPNRAFSYELTDGHWVANTVPQIEGEMFSELAAVSCTGATACTAVGHGYVSGNYQPLIMRWTGTAWSRQTVTLPAGTIASELYGVSCMSETECLAVGARENSSKVWVNYSALWSHGTWASLETPTSESSALSEIRDVSCGSPTSCVAVGWYNPSEGASKPFSLVLAGGSWSLQSRTSTGFLEGITCTSAEFCLAVGTNYSVGPSAETWNGEKWSSLTTASLPDANGGYLSDVSCTSPARCKAVGAGYSKQNGVEVTLVENWDGTSWTEQTTPRESEVARNWLADVSCVGAAGCQAVGYTIASGHWAGLIEKQEEIATASLSVAFGSHGSGPGQFAEPVGLAVDSSGNVWVADTENNRIEEFNDKGEYLSQFGTKGSGNGQLNLPKSIAITASGNLWVTDSGNDRVEEFNEKGEYLAKFGSEGTAKGQFEEPFGIAIAADGHIWVSDARYYRVEEFTSTGEFVREQHGVGQGGTGNGEFAFPTGLAIDPSGDVWVVDTTNNRVQELSPTGEYMSKFGTKGTGNGQFEVPYGIAIKPSSNLLVLERGNSRVEEFTPTGEYLTQFGTKGTGKGQFYEPIGGLALGLGGTEYATDPVNSRVEKWYQPAKPGVVTLAASSVNSTEATLAATVYPGALDTHYQFEYGPTTAYGTGVPVPSEDLGAGTNGIAVSRAIKGLEPNTTYHFRSVGSNNDGITYGKDLTFTTAIGTAGQLSGIAVTDPFNGTTSAVSNFGTNWSALGWASGSPAKGEDTASGWRPVGVYPTVNGASFNPTVADTGPGTAAVATMATNPGNAERYFSLWMDMPTPTSTRAGYELRFTYVSTNTYNVKLSKWVGGTQTELASKSSYSFSNGNSFAVVDQGSTVSAWTNTGSGFSQLLSASDSTFAGGNAAVEGAGNITRLTNFKVGQLLTPVANMDAALKALALNDAFATNESPLSGGGAWAALNWDNGGSGHNAGRVEGGWGPYDAYSAINGAYWTKASFADTGAGDAVSALLYAKPNGTSRYFSLWLDMPTPASAHTGYELRFTETSPGVYEVALAKWQAGTKTVLASKASYSFSTSSQFALVDKAGTVSAWTKTGSEYTQLLSATDTTFTSGYAGVEGSGNITRLKEFRSSPLSPF
jgi:sugar lactone lactonase YvrE